MSLGAIVFVGAVAWGATGAFFSDTETSSGNTFTAGAIDLTVDSTSHYAGLVCSAVTAGVYHWIDDPADATSTTRADLLDQPCSGTWTATDLGASNQFFNFGDVKPGDPGEDTVSLHINNNDAWACMDLTTNSNNENDLIEPEASAGDVTPGPIGGGELAQNLSFTTWRDNASTSGAVPGDNIHQASEQILSGPVFASSLIGATTTLALADSTTATGPMTGGATGYVGIAWCVGTQAVDGTTGAISCDGSTVPNTVQTDSATSTVSFRVVQSRNNANFTCGAGQVAGNPNEINQADLATTTAGALAGNWFFYNDTNDTVMTLDQFSGTGGQNHMESVAGEAGAKMVLDSGVNPRYNIATGQFGGTLLSAISSLKFRVYDATVDSDTPFIQFNVDFATSTITGGFQNRLTMQPGSSTNAPLASATWTTVDALNGGNAMWTWSGFAKGPDKTAATGDDNTWPDGNTNEYRTWNSIVTAFPTAKLLTPGSFLGVRDGQPGPAGATDYVSSIEFNGTVYNFEL